MRAPVDAAEVAGEFQRGAEHPVAGRERVEYADADVRMSVQSKQDEALAACVHVVQQHAHANPAVGSVQYLRHQQPAGQVVVPDVGLDVDAAAGRARCVAAQGERLHAVGDQAEAGLAFVPGRRRCHFGVQAGIHGGGQRRLVRLVGARR